MPVFPIGFSIHNTKIVNEVPDKTKLVASLIPGNISTYIYHNEKDYYDDYKKSFFAITHKKGGWDCMRHYEILACGCIPLFTDLEQCPPDIMTLFPKDIILQTNKIYKEIMDKGGDSVELAHKMCLKEIYIRPLLEYTRNQLTNSKIAQYILEKSGHSHVKRILVLSGDTNPDYLRCVTLPGFKELYGTDCHDYPKIPHIYTDYSEKMARELYGRGLSYSRVISPDLRNASYDETVEEDIRTHKYDVVIYGSYHRGRPFWDLVNSSYEKKDIIMLCGEDLHHCDYDKYDSEYIKFVRELL